MAVEEEALTKRLISIRVFTVVMAAFCAPADMGWAEGPQNTPGVSQFVPSSQFSLLPPFIGENQPGTSERSPGKFLVLLNLGQSLTVKTQYVEKRPEDAWKSLSTQGQTQGQIRALATSSILDRFLTAEGELAYSSPEAKSLQGIGDRQHRLLRFGAKGAWADFMYGAEYRSVGKHFVNLAGPKFAGDQEGGELWLQKKFGIFGARVSLSDFTNNTAEDPLIPKITKVLGGASVSVAPASWPVLSLFYSKGAQWSSNEPSDFHPQTGSFDSVGTSINYKASQWDTTFSSTYSLTDITSRLGKEQVADGRFRLNSSRVQTSTPALSLGINYRPSILAVQVTTFGSYTRTHTSDGYTNNNAFNLSTLLTWTLGESTAGKNTLSLSASFKRYTDNIDPGGSNKDSSVWLRLKIAAF